MTDALDETVGGKPTTLSGPGLGGSGEARPQDPHLDPMVGGGSPMDMNSITDIGGALRSMNVNECA